MNTNLARSFDKISESKGTLSVKTGSGIRYPEKNNFGHSEVPFKQKARTLLKDELSTSPLQNFKNNAFLEIGEYLAKIVDNIENDPTIPITSVQAVLSSKTYNQTAPSTSTPSVGQSMNKGQKSQPKIK